MPKIALSYQKEGHARSLAKTVEESFDGYTIDILNSNGGELLYDLLTGSYDIIQADEALRKGVVGAMVSEHHGIPLVLDIQGWADYFNSHGQYGILTKAFINLLSNFTFSRADGVIFVTRATKRRFKHQNGIKTWRYAKPIFDVERYSTASTKKETKRPTLLTVTNLRYQEKLAGVKTILNALSRLYPNFDGTYKIAGGGRHLNPLRTYVDEYQYADRVKVLGYRNDIPELLNAADIFVYVSYLDSLAMTVLEAQAAGVPVIAGDTGGIPEAVGEAGIVCPPTEADVAESIRTLFENPNLQEAYADFARDRMAKYRRRQATGHVELWKTVCED